MDLKKTPAQIIMELCNQAGISRNELARRLNVTPSQISRITNEETKTISSEILIAIAKEFGVSADYILGLTDVNNTVKEAENGVMEQNESTSCTPMLLMSSAFPLGKCLEFIENIDDMPQREMAYACLLYTSRCV